MNSFLGKDNSKAVSKIAYNPGLVEDLTNDEKRDLLTRFSKYAPKTDAGKKALLKVNSLLSNDSMSDAELVIENHAEAARNIAENSAVLELHISQPWFQQRIKSDVFLEESGNKGKVDPTVLHVVQDLISKKRTKDIMMHRIRFTSSLKMLSVPGGILSLGNGQYLIPLKNIDKVVTMIEDFINQRNDLIAELEANYATIQKEAKLARGSFFDKKDYPPFAEIRKQYNLTYRFLSNAVPEELKKVNKDIYDSEKTRIENELMDATVQIRLALREGFKELIDHFTERLRPDEVTGKSKAFHLARVTKLKEFIETFNNRNLTNDAELEALTKKASDLLSGVSINDIRKDETVKSSLTASFEALKLETDQLIVNKSRAVDLD